MTNQSANQDTLSFDMSIFDNGPVCIFRWDGVANDEGVHPVRFVTKNVGALLGYSQEELLARTVEYGNLVDDRDIARVLANMKDHEESGAKTAFTDQYRVVHKSGKVIWVSDHTQLILNEDGSPKELVGYISDITELMEEREKVSALEIARAAAEQADKTKSQFLANMSHEIRTPMNGVMGMAELLAATELNPKQKNFANIIVKSGEALLTVINDILDFSKIDAGEMELHPEPFDLADSIEDVAILVSAQAAAKQIELAVRFDPRLPRMFVGDGARLRQVISNLMSNAVKFTKAGHVLVDVGGTLTERDGSECARLTVRIEDTGVGIPEDKLTTIFDKFTQVDNSATRTHEGTGLGLSICKSLIELMGGTIGVDSTLDQGSVFWFEVELPVHHAARKVAAPPVDVTGASILIIDDNAVNRSILEEQMTAWGFKSKSAASGVDGITLLRAAPTFGSAFDAVILDYHMPGMNGADVAEAIRADAEVGQTPIVMLTSVDQADIGAQLSAFNIDGHLTKPAKASILLEVIVSALQSRRHQVIEPMEVAAQAKPREFLFRTPSNTTGQKIDILIAEDNEVNKIVYAQILDTLDYSYEMVSNGREAVEFFQTRTPRIIIMDVSMPEMNGLEATAAIRTHEAAAGGHVPIIGITAHAMSGDMERCLDGGMDDYLSKPISPSRLTEKLEKWLGAGHASTLALA